MSKRKIYKTNPIRKYIILSLFIIFFIGSGYSILSTALTATGSLSLEKYDQTLYGVLEKAAKKTNLAQEYTGAHHDSFTVEPTKKIYHWYADYSTNGIQNSNLILEKNNVIFANYCWQMYRTTDTGGVKLIYNGEVEDNKCLDTRGTHLGYSNIINISISSGYWFGTDYEYDEATNQFTLSGTKEQLTTWNQNTSSNVINKYTCRSTNENDSCQRLYLIAEYNSDTSAYAIPFTNVAGYSNIGIVSYNRTGISPTYVGYMYGDINNVQGEVYGTMNSYRSDSRTLISRNTLSTSYYYADSYDYGVTTSERYSLTNPYQVSSSNDYSSLVGKYSFFSNNINAHNTWIRKIVAIDGNYSYSYYASNGEVPLDYIVLGESITENVDNTYSLNNTITVSLSDWMSNYSEYKFMYTCDSTSTTCAIPRFITSTTNTSYSYYNLNKKILIAKNRNGLSLSDTLLVRDDQLRLNRDEYKDYKYTCNNTDNVCSLTNMRYIYEYNETYYKYVMNYYVGASVTWDGTKYTVHNIMEIEDLANLHKATGYHYACLGKAQSECEQVAYIFSATTSNADSISAIMLSNGETQIEALNRMLYHNNTKSTIKTAIDKWYQKNLISYSNAIEDTIYCNDRSYPPTGNYSFNKSSWNDQEGFVNNSKLYFRNAFASAADLSCPNTTDKFSINNPEAQLSYPVGLATQPEMALLGNSTNRNVGECYWLMSPYNFGWGNGGFKAQVWVINNSGGISSTIVEVDGNYKGTIRPVISLKPGTKYSSGDGSKENPYIVDTQ